MMITSVVGFSCGKGVEMNGYIGTKDGRVFLSLAKTPDDAELNIGELMCGQRPSEIDLDFLGLIPDYSGPTMPSIDSMTVEITTLR